MSKFLVVSSLSLALLVSAASAQAPATEAAPGTAASENPAPPSIPVNPALDLHRAPSPGAAFQLTGGPGVPPSGPADDPSLEALTLQTGGLPATTSFPGEPQTAPQDGGGEGQDGGPPVGPPVPEPETWILFLTGIGLISWMLWRRHSARDLVPAHQRH